MNLEQLRTHSLNVILQHQHESGAFLACPDMPDYQFSWFRDGSYIAYALTIDSQTIGLGYDGSMAAQIEAAGRFHDWCARVIMMRSEALERTIKRANRGEPFDRADSINARYHVDGSAGPIDWPEFQLDGPGMWLWSLAAYVPAARVTPLPSRWLEVIDLVGRYLSATWQAPCYDYWEERGDDVHISTLGAIYAGLLAADGLLGETRFAPEAQKIRDFVLAKGLTPDGELAKSLGRDMVDANLISVSVPHGLLAPDNPTLLRTIARIERDLNPAGSGVHRHVEDVYYGGGVWVLLALWLAWYYIEAGHADRARELFDWAVAQADTEGNLPEQTIEHMLNPPSYEPWVEERGPIAQPLLWSHAKFLIVYHAIMTA